MDLNDLYIELKEIREIVNDIKISTARNTDSLDYHIRRTDLLEKKLDLLDTDITKVRGFISIGGWILALAATVIAMLTRGGAFFK